MTDRITPLPWTVNTFFDQTVSALIVGADDKYVADIAAKGKHQENHANAAYIVRACNTLPKLEALNLELQAKLDKAVEVLEFYADKNAYGANSSAPAYVDVLTISDCERLDDYWYGGKKARETLAEIGKG